MDCSAMQFSDCAKVVLQVEVSVKHRQQFDQKYSELTGKKASGESFIPTESKETHRAPILSVFFIGAAPSAIKNLRMLGFEVSEFQHGEFSHCVVGEKMWWMLVRNGYRIGSQRGIAVPVVKPVGTKCEVEKAALVAA
jgi:cephalosporin-C deacetylase-like acetyl esterase